MGPPWLAGPCPWVGLTDVPGGARVTSMFKHKSKSRGVSGAPVHTFCVRNKWHPAIYTSKIYVCIYIYSYIYKYVYIKDIMYVMYVYVYIYECIYIHVFGGQEYIHICIYIRIWQRVNKSVPRKIAGKGSNSPKLKGRNNVKVAIKNKTVCVGFVVPDVSQKTWEIDASRYIQTLLFIHFMFVYSLGKGRPRRL